VAATRTDRINRETKPVPHVRDVILDHSLADPQENCQILQGRELSTRIWIAKLSEKQFIHFPHPIDRWLGGSFTAVIVFCGLESWLTHRPRGFWGLHMDGQLSNLVSR
jgi:hypothetical protein